jgi:hypothetical protein
MPQRNPRHSTGASVNSAQPSATPDSAAIKAVSAQPTTLPPILRQAWMLILACVAVSTALHVYWDLVKHASGHYVWPFSLNDRDRFADFTIFKEKYAHWPQADFFSVGFPINYPAPITDFFEFFFHFFRYPTVAFVVFTTLCFVVPAILFARALRARGLRPVVATWFAITLFLFSWPVLLLIDGANMEVAVWVVTALGFWGFATGREKTAAVSFGLAGSFKLFPFVLLALFFSQKKWKALLLGLATMGLSTLIALWILGPTIPQAWAGIAFGLASFKTNYMAQWHSGENGVDHSIFALVKFVMILAHLHGSHDFFKPLAVYLALSAIVGLGLYFLRIRFLPLVNQALLLTISCIYLTAFSGDGTLIHLHAPFAMLTFLVIDAWKRKVHIPGLQAMFLTLTFILTPVSFLIFKDHRFEGEVKCVALGVLSYLALRYPIGPPLFTDERPDALAYPDAALVPGAAPEAG